MKRYAQRNRSYHKCHRSVGYTVPSAHWLPYSEPRAGRGVHPTELFINLFIQRSFNHYHVHLT